MENPNITPETETNKKKPLDKWELVGFAWELGYIIALPIIIFGLLGKWIDERLGHEVAWVTLIAIVLAITATTFWLIKKLKNYIK